jgi:hypothetical protein
MTASGRFLPVEITGFLQSERPLLIKADAQISDSEKPRLRGRFALATSTGRRNTLSKTFCWCSKV